jgi:hypothetical protein
VTSLTRAQEIEILAARVGRFYGESLSWALALPIQRLLHWAGLMAEVRAREPEQIVRHEHVRR